MLVNQAREQARKLNEPSPSTLKLGSSARKQAREQARAYSFKTEPSRACLILGSTRLGYTPSPAPPLLLSDVADDGIPVFTQGLLKKNSPLISFLFGLHWWGNVSLMVLMGLIYFVVWLGFG